MDLTFSAEERAFESEVREFIAQHLTPEMKRAQALTPSVFSDPEIGIAWQKSLHRKGWGAPGWPVEHGDPTGPRHSAGFSRPNAPAPARRPST